MLDNPTDPFDINDFTCNQGTVDQRKRSFMVEFDAKNTWDLTFAISGTATSGRNVLFAFASEMCNLCQGTGAGCGGDPHFQRWNQDKRDTFHGECDLVLLHKENFASSHQDLDIHVRTTIKNDSWSYIESAAVKIGDDIVEVDEKGDLFINGAITELDYMDDPFFFRDGYSVAKLDVKKTSSYVVDLAGRAVIVIKATGLFHTVTMDALPSAMIGSTGMLGAYGSGEMIGRQGQVMDDFVSFGFEWQVDSHDPRLFRTSREPQLPYEQ